MKVPEIIKEARKDMVNIGSCHPAFKGMNEVLRKYPNIYAEEEAVDFGREKKAAGRIRFLRRLRRPLPGRRSHRSRALSLLDRLRVDYTLIDEVCCSGVLEDVGFPLNDTLVQTNIDRILATGATTVITGCPYCARTLNNKVQYVPLGPRA